MSKVFAFLHLFEPHTPYEPPEPYKSRYPSAYDGEIARADEIVGDFLDFLKGRGLYESAVIIFLSDHGEGLNDHGEEEHGVLLYREAIRVPLLVKLPGSRRGGEDVASPVALIDVFPTITALLGLSPPPGLPGIPLTAAPRAAAAARRVYSETLYPRLHLGWSDLASSKTSGISTSRLPGQSCKTWLPIRARRRTSRRACRPHSDPCLELSRLPRALQAPGASTPSGS